MGHQHILGMLRLILFMLQSGQEKNNFLRKVGQIPVIVELDMNKVKFEYERDTLPLTYNIEFRE